jgi:2-methylcitrate dehydratase PrpD
LSLAGATLLNGYLITAVTVCDVHRPTLYHTTPQVVSPALAIAERDGASGRALLTAITAGLETSVRVANGTHYAAFRSRGWHSPGVVGPFGGAAAVGKLRGFNADKQLMAFGLAGSQSAGTFAHWGTPTIKFHQCRGALSGLMAGLLAEQGFLASKEILTHKDGGIYNAYSDGGKPETVTADLGKQWALEQISLRLWPAASSVQSVITALLALVETHNLKPIDIAEVRVGLSKGVYDMQDATVSAFARDRVKVSVDTSIQGTAALVEIKTTAGVTHTDRRLVAKGDAADPLSRAEIQAKLRTAAKGVIASAAVDRIVALVDGLESVDNVRELLDAVRA